MKMLYALLLTLSIGVIQASDKDQKTEPLLSLLATPRQDAPSSDDSSSGSARSDSDHSPEQHLRVRPRSKTAGMLLSRMAAKEGTAADLDDESGRTVHFVIEKSGKDAAAERKTRIEAPKSLKTEGKRDHEPEVSIEPTRSVLALLTDTMQKHTKSPEPVSGQRRKTVHGTEWRRNRAAAMTALPDQEREEQVARIAKDASLTSGQKVQKIAALRKVHHLPTGEAISHWKVAHGVSVAERGDKTAHVKADYHE